MRVVAQVCGLALLILVWIPAASSQRTTRAPAPPPARGYDVMSLPITDTEPASPRLTDPAKLRSDADKLADLAAAVRLEIDQVNRGVLPKDLNPNLKRIEKLAKQLHAEIEP